MFDDSPRVWEHRCMRNNLFSHYCCTFLWPRTSTNGAIKNVILLCVHKTHQPLYYSCPWPTWMSGEKWQRREEGRTKWFFPCFKSRSRKTNPPAMHHQSISLCLNPILKLAVIKGFYAVKKSLHGCFRASSPPYFRFLHHHHHHHLYLYIKFRFAVLQVAIKYYTEACILHEIITWRCFFKASTTPKGRGH